MKRATVLTTLFLVALSLPFSMAAHDAKLHKGKATEGEITSVSGDSFDMKTTARTVSVTLSDKTKIEHGDATVDKTHLKAGEHVSVFGTKVSKTKISATEVVMGTGDAHEHGKMTGTATDKMKSMDHGKMK